MIQGLRRGGRMSRKPRVDRTPEEKWQIVQEGMKSGNVSETCRRDGIPQTLWFAKTLADFEINDIAGLPPLFCYNS